MDNFAFNPFRIIRNESLKNFCRLLPDPDHIKCQMCKGKDERNDQQDFTLFPTDGLLMPKPCDHTKDGKDDTDHIQGLMAAAIVLIVLQLTVFDAVASINVQSDQHPEHQSDPSVGR